MSHEFKVAILTTSRSDFGLLKNVIRHIAKISELTLFIGGSHLVDKNSYEEIQEFTETIELKKILLNFESKIKNDLSSSKQIELIGSMGSLLIKYFDELKIDLLIIIGDRWEILSASIAALLGRIPLAHISGGEITQGAIDESIRHSLTKMSHLHFASCPDYARNISLMGEEDWRITISGECGLDWIHSSKFVSKEKICNQFNISLNNKNKLALFTYHPTSYGDMNVLNEELDVLVSILKTNKNIDFIVTGPGMELGSDKARGVFQELSKNIENIFYIEHLGRENYLSMMKYSDLVIGNSSSGICEAPSVGTPSINIGNRQEGRFRADSTIDCDFDFYSISNALENVFSNKFGDIIKKIENPYDPFLDGKNSERVAKTCIFALKEMHKDKLLKKVFDQKLNSKLWNTLN